MHIDTTKLPADAEVWTSGDCTLIRGDCLAVLPALSGVDAVVTSPPYAMQRAKQYGGIEEAKYPDFTLAWMNATRLNEGGSVFINIREHVSGGQISDYVHRTRLHIRAAGWIECDELIWIKPHSFPAGHTKRPRRSWERVLWFSNNQRARCFPLNNGRQSDRVGAWVSASGATASWSKPVIKEESGIARCRDYVEVSHADSTQNFRHPAKFPIGLPSWLAKLATNEGEMVLDPFTGSGTTGVACVNLNRKFIGIEISPEYFAIAKARIEKAQAAKAEQLIA